jgi:tetratricopeptide (TPR) repeat protein
MARTPSRFVTESPPTPAGIAALTPAAVEEQTDPGSFDRGRAYARQDRLFGRVRRGVAIAAGCHGSSGGPYRVTATLAAARNGASAPLVNPVEYACDCPRGGFCKHVVALLLDWIDDPAGFEERPSVEELVAGMSREDLVALVDAMLRRAPELEALIETPLPTPESLPSEAVDEAAIRRQIRDAVDVADEDVYDRYDGWYGSNGPSHDGKALERLLALGRVYAEAERWRDALAVFGPMVEVIGPDIEYALDEEGVLIAALRQVDAVLADCLRAQAGLPNDRRLAPGDRQRLFEVLLDLWEADIAGGGWDIAEEAPVAIGQAATPTERREAQRRVRALIKPPSDEYSDQSSINRDAIAFLDLLAGEDGMPPEQLLEEYRAAALWDEAAALLVDLDRVDEAIGLVARRLDNASALMKFADHLLANGDPARVGKALDLVEARLWEREGKAPQDDVQLIRWLEARYAAHGQPDKALDAAKRAFAIALDQHSYNLVRNAAPRLPDGDERWPTLRSGMLATLRKRKHWGTLTDIFLAEGEVAEAIAAHKQGTDGARRTAPESGSGFGWMPTGYSDPRELRLAEAAERDFPDEAVAIYRRHADRYIANRQRTSYKEAAKLLAKAAAVLRAAGCDAEWDESIAALRLQHKSLRALREELDALGLG